MYDLMQPTNQSLLICITPMEDGTRLVEYKEPITRLSEEWVKWFDLVGEIRENTKVLAISATC